MEGIDSFSKTTEKIVNFSHSWTIENLSFFLHEELIKSPAFGAESDPGTRWCLELYPRGENDGRRDGRISYAMETKNNVNQDPRSHAQVGGAKVFDEIYQTRTHSDVVLSLYGKDF